MPQVGSRCDRPHPYLEPLRLAARRSTAPGVDACRSWSRRAAWIWNEASERFGAVLHGEELPEAVGWATDHVGSDADVYEEFDLLDP